MRSLWAGLLYTCVLPIQVDAHPGLHVSTSSQAFADCCIEAPSLARHIGMACPGCAVQRQARRICLVAMLHKEAGVSTLQEGLELDQGLC